MTLVTYGLTQKKLFPAKKTRQAMYYNVPLRGVRATIAAVEKQ